MRNIILFILDSRSPFKSGNTVPWTYEYSKN